MKLKDWLTAERGRYTKLAEELGVSVGRISQIADDGVPVPYMEPVEKFTGGAVTVLDMVRDTTTAKAARAAPAEKSRA